MVWFKVDDKLHSHPKTSNASLAAIGLWTLAGSWCGDHTTDGRIPSSMIASLARGAVELADELVAAGLWVRAKDGYRFHQWLADADGTKRNPSKKEVEENRKRKADAGRKGGLASGRARSRKQARASPVVPDPLNPRPDPLPSKEGGSGDVASRFAHDAPLRRPEDHSLPVVANGHGEAPIDLNEVRAKIRAASKKIHARDRPAVSAFDRLMAEPTPADAAHVDARRLGESEDR